MADLDQIQTPDGTIYDINAKKVNGYTVEANVPSDAVFTDTTVAGDSSIIGSANASYSNGILNISVTNKTVVTDIYSVENVIYGMRIDGSKSDGSKTGTKVTYLEDCANFNPAYMNYTTGVFNYGSWREAFFIPKPCMLKYDGTVDYYLDPDDYSKKLDGTASDYDDFNYDGNVMLEWGRDGRRIWYKIVPDTNDNTSANIYIANYKADDNYHAWSFYDYNNVLKDHFYTPAYNGTLDGSGRLRSISGKTYSQLCQSKTAAQEITAAELNNTGTDKGWYTEVFADVMLIQLLCYLMGKSTDVQTTFGNGRINQTSAASSMIGTGTMDDKGLFWGGNGNNDGVKVFGMENFWANQWRRYAGHYLVEYVNKYKLTRGIADGSTVSDYSTSSTTGYLTGGTSPSSNGYQKELEFNSNGLMTVKTIGATATTYYYDYFYQTSGTRYAIRGGACNSSATCGFYVRLDNAASVASWSIGAAPSYK